MQTLGRGLARARERGWLNDLHVTAFDNMLTELTNVQGGCERIRNTPVPYAYGVLSHRVVAVFCFFLPLGIVDDVGAYTPFVTLLVSYAFFGLDSLGSEVEEPFGTDLTTFRSRLCAAPSKSTCANCSTKRTSPNFWRRSIAC